MSGRILDSRVANIFDIIFSRKIHQTDPQAGTPHEFSG